MKSTSRTKFACLSTLRVAPMSGYKIAESCNEWFSHFWKESYGQIYPTLKKLLLAGDIEKLPPQKGQRGDIYKITTKGERTLEQWLREPAVPATLRDEYYLKFFSASAVSSDLHLEHLSRKRQHLKDALDSNKSALEHLEHLPHPDRKYWQLMVRYGVISYEAELAWLDEAEDFLKEKKSGGNE